MKQTIRTIAPRNESMKFPITPTILAYLMYDKFPNPQWVWGIVGLFIVLVWILCIYSLFRTEYVDIFEELDKCIKS